MGSEKSQMICYQKKTHTSIVFYCPTMILAILALLKKIVGDIQSDTISLEIDFSDPFYFIDMVLDSGEGFFANLDFREVWSLHFVPFVQMIMFFVFQISSVRESYHIISHTQIYNKMIRPPVILTTPNVVLVNSNRNCHICSWNRVKLLLVWAFMWKEKIKFWRQRTSLRG